MLLLIIHCLLPGYLLHAQVKPGLYAWKESVPMQPCRLSDGVNAKGSDSKPLPLVVSLPGQKFRALKVINRHVIIKILDYTFKEKDTLKPLPDFFRYNFHGSQDTYKTFSRAGTDLRNYEDSQLYFKISVDTLEAYAREEKMINGALTCGVISFPFKFRPQKIGQDFSGSFNFGAGIGYTFKHKSWRSYTLSLLSGYSISNTILDSSSTTKNQSSLSSTNNFTAFSFSLGIMTEYQNKIQAGIFIGWDRINRINNNQFNWQYQGKPWLSIGFGVAVFSKEKEREERNSVQKLKKPKAKFCTRVRSKTGKNKKN